MTFPSLRSASLLSLVALVGCYSTDCGSFDIPDTLLSGFGDGCGLATSGDPITTDGEATIHATLLTNESVARIARGAEVSVVARVPGTPESIAVATEGGLVLLDVGEPYTCGGDGAGGGGGSGSSQGGAGGEGGEGGGDAAPGATQTFARFRADGEGVLVVSHGEEVSRWSPVIADATSLTLEPGDPAECTVGSSCLVRGVVTDAEGGVLYAEEDFTWSTTISGETQDHPGVFAFEPTESGTVVVTATVLGLEAEVTIVIR